MYRPGPFFLLSIFLLCFCCAPARGQGIQLGIYQSPKGIGASLVLDSRSGTEMDLLTLRTDFYGVLSGRTRTIGAVLTYTHDYVFFRTEGEDFLLRAHAGAGGQAGFVHDFEKGFLSAYDRELEHNPGWMAALTGNIGVRVDFKRRLSLDVGVSISPGVHLRTDKSTGALLVSFYHCGIYHAYYPHLMLMYRF